jgi:hypothetical protein
MIFFNIGGSEDGNGDWGPFQIRLAPRSRDNNFFEPLVVCRTGDLRARRIAWERGRSEQYKHPDNARAYFSICHRFSP